jgi:fucose 4-O-acetylase-like acetyltransferase
MAGGLGEGRCELLPTPIGCGADIRGEILLERDDRLDVLRGIGLLCIILAHVGPPRVLFEIRNFDVPLMVLVAGSAFAISTQTRPKLEYLKYIKSRFIRLVIPTWIFLVTFFLITLIASMIMHKPYPFSSDTILSSFLLLSGIGCVWIIRVFLLVSLIAPFTLFLGISNPNSLKRTFFIILVMYAIYEISARFIHIPDQTFLKILLNEILFMVIPYGCIFFFGTRLYLMSGKKILFMSFISFLLFAVYAAVLYEKNCHIVPIQTYKYPPTAYYILYAMFFSTCLYWFSQTDIYSYIPGKKWISFLGRSSLWIYLWHILILFLIRWSYISMNFAVQYLVVLGASVSIVMLQVFILDRVLLSTDSQKTKRILKTIFRG